MIVKIVYCERCDDIKFPEELIKWSGACRSCKKDTARIALFDMPDSEKPVLKEIK